MAARSILRRLCSRPPPPTVASVQWTRLYGNSAAAEKSTEKRRRRRQDDKEIEWVTLPPFTPAVDGGAIGKNISRHQTESPETAASRVTALKWVSQCYPELPWSLVRKLFRLENVRRYPPDNAQKPKLWKVSARYCLEDGDVIYIPAATVDSKAPSAKAESNSSEEERKFLHSLIIYKDPAMIVVNKPHGMPVQGGIGIKWSLDELATRYLRFDHSESPRLVHRLDRDCSGILVMGRSQLSAAALHSIFREKTFEASELDNERSSQVIQKTYWALVIGSPRKRKGVISQSLGKVLIDNGKSDRITVIDDRQSSSAQCAVTEYKVVGRPSNGFTWLELSPLTGRKHQLRVHCAEVLGTPILGDYKYGWQAHKNLKFEEKVQKQDPFNLDFRDGSILDKQPRLHLHCKRMILPDVSQALDQAESGADYNLEDARSINLFAPLPYHMQKSFDLINSGDLLNKK